MEKIKDGKSLKSTDSISNYNYRIEARHDNTKKGRFIVAREVADNAPTCTGLQFI